jgi:hypothetical protein
MDIKDLQTALLYYGEHHVLCKAVKQAKEWSPTAEPSKVHGDCTCGLSDVLLGRPINEFCRVLEPVAQGHLEYGKMLENYGTE